MCEGEAELQYRNIMTPDDMLECVAELLTQTVVFREHEISIDSLVLFWFFVSDPAG